MVTLDSLYRCIVFFVIYCFLLFLSIPYFRNRNGVFIYVWHLGCHVFRTSHTAHYQLLLSSIASIVALFSLLFISVQYFNNGVSIYVCCFDRLESLLNEMHFHDLNESYDSYEFAGPGPSLMRCSFTKSNVMLFSLKVSHSPLARTTRTSRILAFTTRTSGEYWT